MGFSERTGAQRGSNRTSGDVAVVGSHDLSARTAGSSAGLDYRLALARSWASRDSIFFPRPPPPGLSKDLLGRMIAWRIQEQAFGGLDRESLTFLEVWRTTAA
jgi:hypothetical protein